MGWAVRVGSRPACASSGAIFFFFGLDDCVFLVGATARDSTPHTISSTPRQSRVRCRPSGTTAGGGGCRRRSAGRGIVKRRREKEGVQRKKKKKLSRSSLFSHHSPSLPAPTPTHRTMLAATTNNRPATAHRPSSRTGAGLAPRPMRPQQRFTPPAATSSGPAFGPNDTVIPGPSFVVPLGLLGMGM